MIGIDLKKPMSPAEFARLVKVNRSTISRLILKGTIRITAKGKIIPFHNIIYIQRRCRKKIVNYKVSQEEKSYFHDLVKTLHSMF